MHAAGLEERLQGDGCCVLELADESSLEASYQARSHNDLRHRRPAGLQRALRPTTRGSPATYAHKRPAIPAHE